MDDDVIDLPAVDTPPSTGVWADEHPPATIEEAAIGQALGQAIDTDDDDDNGLSVLGMLG